MSRIAAALQSATEQLGHERARALYHICLAVQAAARLHAAADTDYATGAEAASTLLVDQIALAVDALGIPAQLVNEMAEAIAEERGTLWRPRKN